MLKYAKKGEPPRSCSFNVSSHGKYPWKLFSPFSTEFLIPHPQESLIICDSVERLWQGSKCCFKLGEPDYDILNNTKRWTKGVIPQFGIYTGNHRSTTDIGLGRRLVYVPAYIHFVNKVLTKHFKDIYGYLREKVQSPSIYYLYDFDYNTSFDKPEPLSHAIILVNYLNLYFY